jgi:hypothetical protein
MRRHGVAIVALATARFGWIRRRLDDPEEHSASGVRAELILATVLVLIVGAFPPKGGLRERRP